MPACRNHPDRPDGRLPTQASAQARRPSRSIIPFPYMPRVADLPPGWRHFTAGQKIEHLISLDRCCHEILSWEPITELDSVRLSFQMQVMRILLRIGLKAVLDAGSLRLLPTRPKQPGASKGATTSSPRPRTRSSNPVPSSAESANYRFRARLPTLVRVASSASAFGLVPKTRSRRAQARSDGRPQQRAAPRGPLASTRD